MPSSEVTVWATCPSFRQQTVPPSGKELNCGLKKKSPIETSTEPVGHSVGGGGGGGGAGGGPRGADAGLVTGSPISSVLVGGGTKCRLSLPSALPEAPSAVAAT